MAEISTLDPDTDQLTPADEWPAIPPTLITIHRTSPEDCRQRQVVFSLDGKRIATLLYGDVITCEIPPGRHRLRANNTLLWTTLEFDAAPASHLHFTCVNRAPRGFIYMLAVFGVAPLFVTLAPGKPSTGQLSADRPRRPLHPGDSPPGAGARGPISRS
jgi:hypothetical protein